MVADNPEQCFALLHKMATLSEFDSAVAVDLWRTGDMLGFDPSQTQRLARQLMAERMLDATPVAGSLRVSVVGLAAISLACADPDKASVHFPALSGFLGLDGEQDLSLGKHSVSVLLDQLADCRGVLGNESDSGDPLEIRLGELERVVGSSRVEKTSLRRGLQKLRESLPD